MGGMPPGKTHKDLSVSPKNFRGFRSRSFIDKKCNFKLIEANILGSAERINP